MAQIPRAPAGGVVTVSPMSATELPAMVWQQKVDSTAPTWSRDRPPPELRWLADLVEDLGVLGKVRSLTGDRLHLQVTQAEINELQGRDRNSGVVSRRCNKLRRIGVLEPGMPLVVRANELPSPRSLRAVPPGETLRDGCGIAPAPIEPYNEATPAPSATAAGQDVLHGSLPSLLDALAHCAREKQWALMGRLLDTVEHLTAPRADPRPIPREPRGARVTIDDDVRNSSSSSSNGAEVAVGRAGSPKRAGGEPRGTTDPVNSRGNDVAKPCDTPREDPPGVAHPVRVRAYVTDLATAVDTGARANRTGYGASRDEMLEAVAPLRELCQVLGLPDLDDVEVLARSFTGWRREEIDQLVGDMLRRLHAGVKVRSPFGLLISTARRGPSATGPIHGARPSGTALCHGPTPTDRIRERLSEAESPMNHLSGDGFDSLGFVGEQLSCIEGEAGEEFVRRSLAQMRERMHESLRSAE